METQYRDNIKDENIEINDSISPDTIEQLLVLEHKQDIDKNALCEKLSDTLSLSTFSHKIFLRNASILYCLFSSVLFSF